MRRKRWRLPPPAMRIRRIGSSEGSKRRIAGRLASRGKVTRSSFSRTESEARSMRVEVPNSSVTSDWPGRETECTRTRPGTTPTPSSIGRVTNCSTSPGAASGKSVRMLSEGYEMSGRRSTERRLAATRPNSTTPRVTMNTVTGRRIEPSTSFTAFPSGSELDRLDAGPLLEAALSDGDHGVTLGQTGQHLRRVSGGGAELNDRLGHGVAVRDEHVVLAVLFQHRAARQHHHVLEAAGAQPHASEIAGSQQTLRIVYFERHLHGAVRAVHHRIHQC